ncbi:hypothetical protein CK203_095084 [Vitis vinifera]|uniref:Uncharacterized protein n=1 Tax=Vitis vinifera TaxID=29760 RepID=A0A438EWM3_VITVI|nr:hypothetical protein CK203_095084 [Vitis vinifera]
MAFGTAKTRSKMEQQGRRSKESTRHSFSHLGWSSWIGVLLRELCIKVFGRHCPIVYLMENMKDNGHFLPPFWPKLRLIHYFAGLIPSLMDLKLISPKLQRLILPKEIAASPLGSSSWTTLVRSEVVMFLFLAATPSTIYIPNPPYPALYPYLHLPYPLNPLLSLPHLLILPPNPIPSIPFSLMFSFISI